MPAVLLSFTKVGTTAGTFLKIGIGARACGMGEAFVAVADNASCFYWNPAGAVFIEGSAIEGGVTSWFAGIKHYSFSLVFHPLKYTAMGFGVVNVRSGKMEVTTILEPEGTGQYFEATSLLAGIFISRKLYERFSVGGMLKVVEESIYHEKARAIAFDIGTLFKTEWKELKIGMNLQNFGEKMKLSGTDLYISTDPFGEIGGNPSVDAELKTESWPLPILFRVGISIKPWKNILFALDGIHNSEGREKILVGLEYSLYSFSLRCGYRIMEDEGGLTLGFGLRVKNGGRALSFDYAYQDWGRLKGVHRFGLGIGSIGK
jgi:hypothetical protein